MAVSFNGSSDVVDMGQGIGSLALADNSPMSMMCWLNFANFTGTQNPLGYGFDGGANKQGYFFQATSSILTVGSYDGTHSWGGLDSF